MIDREELERLHEAVAEDAVLKRFADDVQNVQSRIVIVHQLRASADIQDRATKAETGWADTSDRAMLMRRAASTIEALAAENASLRAELLEQAKANGAGAEREAKLMAERDAALRECTKWACEAGEAKGRLEGSELPGIVDGWREKCEALERRCERLREALTPSAETKAAYMGEFSWTEWLPDENGTEQGHEMLVPWTTIKEIMAAIRECAALEGDEG